MSVGFAADKSAIDARAGGLSVQLRETFQAVELFAAFIAATDLTQIAGYSADDIAAYKQKWPVIDALRQAFEGALTINGNPVDFRPYVNTFIGVN